MAVYIRKQPLRRDEGPNTVMGIPRHGRDPSVPVRPVSPDPVSFDGNTYTLLVSDAAESCRKKGHPVEGVTGILVSLDGKPVRLRVDYCQKCKKYFVSKEVFESCRATHGRCWAGTSSPGQAARRREGLPLWRQNLCSSAMATP